MKNPFGLLDIEMEGADPCHCGVGFIPKRVDGVQWYWQRHSRTACTLELPNKRCWCGLLRSEHVEGHNPEVVYKDDYDSVCRTLKKERERCKQKTNSN